MHTAGPISRKIIDSWPISQAGLPVRVVNCTRGVGVETVGQLRAMSDPELLRLRSLGRVSLQHIHFFFGLCDRVERGVQVFHNIQEILDIFLDSSELFVLAARYGCHRPESESSRQCVTLQDIGNHLNRTRERVRQVEETGKEQLASHLCAACLESFARFLADFIEERGGAVAGEDMGALKDAPSLAGLNPVAIALLLGDLGHPRLTAYRGLFSTLPEKVLADLDSAATEKVAAAEKPTTVEELLPQLAEPLVDCGTADPKRVLTTLLNHAEGVVASVDNRYFTFDRSLEVFLLEVLTAQDRPAHYRAVTGAFNDRVKPRNRKGAGFVLEALNACPAVVRTDRGFYDLR